MSHVKISKHRVDTNRRSEVEESLPVYGNLTQKRKQVVDVINDHSYLNRSTPQYSKELHHKQRTRKVCRFSLAKKEIIYRQIFADAQLQVNFETQQLPTFKSYVPIFLFNTEQLSQSFEQRRNPTLMIRTSYF